jgi:hypothetical protein
MSSRSLSRSRSRTRSRSRMSSNGSRINRSPFLFSDTGITNLKMQKKNYGNSKKSAGRNRRTARSRSRSRKRRVNLSKSADAKDAKVVASFRKMSVKCPKKRPSNCNGKNAKQDVCVRQNLCDSAVAARSGTKKSQRSGKDPKRVSTYLMPSGVMRCPEYCATDKNLKGAKLKAQAVCETLKNRCGNTKASYLYV